ncbi:MAG: hypothetical protein Q9227_004472 [Pyrenula ochraceoflavens]
MAKDDGFVMATNNSSIVSKRSVERLYYPEPHFIRYFVSKPVKRSPLINKGYWLRMWAMQRSIEEFLRTSGGRKIVLNLGCGADPTPFRWLSKDPKLCSDVIFVDVDHPQLMKAKVEIIRRTSQLYSLLSNAQDQVEGSFILLKSDQYVAIGCDLRNLGALKEACKSIIGEGMSILCLAEVSITYMELQNSNALISWAAGLSNDVTFCLLEQCLPDGPDHPFAQTMLRHFEKLHSPLRSIQTYQSLQSQEQRFEERGWSRALAVSLWHLWINQARRSSEWDPIQEPFDEWEEFALFASHYFLLTASNSLRKDNKPAERPESTQRKTLAQVFSEMDPRVCNADYTQSRGTRAGRHHGALLIAEYDCVGIHGGMGVHTRLASIDTFTRNPDEKGPLTSPQALPRMCHSITQFSSSRSILVGGRHSPSTALADCYLWEQKKWTRIANLPSARYRHCASPVKVAQSFCLLIFGGKSDGVRVHNEWLLWESDVWRTLPLSGESPDPRFGACMVPLGSTEGVLFGGMDDSGFILDDLFHWEVKISNGRIEGVQVSRVSPPTKVPFLEECLDRFGATVGSYDDRLIIVGGIAKSGTIPKGREIMVVNMRALINFSHEDSHMDPPLCCTPVTINSTVGWPLLVGHSSHIDENGQLLMLGGGAVCFSFGTFWNQGAWTVKLGITPGDILPWKFLKTIDFSEPIPAREAIQNEDLEETAPKPVRVLSDLKTADVKLDEILQERQSLILKGLELGRCVDLWSNDYMINAIGSDKPVVVHKTSTSPMNFQKKNFSYITLPFATFVHRLSSGENMYLRSLSTQSASSLPSNLSHDFPALAKDFQIPRELETIVTPDRIHSSVLRISNAVMWLHYDTYANILCQIWGERTLVLYPPTDIKYLHVPAGASTSQLDIFHTPTNNNASSSPSPIHIPGTHPHTAHLTPGSILFIPPLWLHAGSPPPPPPPSSPSSSSSSPSVAVNVFFDTFEKGQHAAGRDVYGNRDLMAYEVGRKGVERIVRGFEGVPGEVAGAYLGRLAEELRGMGERFGGGG